MPEESRKVDVTITNSGNIFLETRDSNGDVEALIVLDADGAENLVTRLRNAVIAVRELNGIE